MEGIIAGAVGAVFFFISIVCYCCIRVGTRIPKLPEKNREEIIEES